MKNKINIWHISDTHSYHGLLSVPDNINIVIHSGDFSNYFDVYKNEPETKDFLHWYGSLKIPYKVLIAGNHDAVAAKWTKEFKKLCKDYNIIYLENESIEIEGIKIYGTPIQPSFGNWYFQKSRDKLDKFWHNIPEDTDILVIHGPPKGVLDLSYSPVGTLEFCGCKALKRHIMTRLNLKMCLFGHIHNTKDIINQGTLQLTGKDTIFSNGSVLCDGKFGILTSNGNILEYE
jgi:Icc-related predicted phosphoesterase